MNKGFIFGGDSFVWGEGLSLYSSCPKIQQVIEEKIEYDGSRKYSKESWNFQENNRFPSLVANHFNTFSLVFDRNGGDNYSCLDELIYFIRNTDLSKIEYIIYQPTAVWRSCNIVLHPIHTTFGYSGNTVGDYSEISNFKSNKYYKPIGNGDGFKKHDIEIDDNNLCNFFKCIDNNLLTLIELCLAWESNWNTKDKLKDYILESVPDGSTYVKEITDKIEIFYDFVLTEYSEYGTLALDILENIQRKLILDCIDFIQTQIIPLTAEFDCIKFLFLETWCNEIKSWRSINNQWYNTNLIQLSEEWSNVSDKYEINSSDKLGWTNNLHPTLEGHHWFANHIIEYLDK